MKILAVDTSSVVATVAVTEDEKLLGEYSIHHQKTHSQKLLPMIKELMQALELKPEDVDVYAASVGPGSFTGLRIGVTTIKAMAFAVKKPVIGVPTLEALAYNIPESDALVCPIMDARNQQVYTSLYAWEKGQLSALTEPLGIPVQELTGLLRERNKKVIFLGDGVALHRAILEKELGRLCTFAPGRLLLQSAASVALAAFYRAGRGPMESSFELAPFYLRKSQAEREYEKRQQEYAEHHR